MVAELQNSGDPVRQWFPGLMSLLLLLLGLDAFAPHLSTVRDSPSNLLQLGSSPAQQSLGFPCSLALCIDVTVDIIFERLSHTGDTLPSGFPGPDIYSYTVSIALA